jgi:hypothetical protein
MKFAGWRCGKGLLAKHRDRTHMRVHVKREHVCPLYPALVHAGLGDKDLAFSELEAAVEERATNLIPIPRPIISDGRCAGIYNGTEIGRKTCSPRLVVLRTKSRPSKLHIILPAPRGHVEMKPGGETLSV